MVLNLWINNKDWFQVMNVASLDSLFKNGHLWANSSVRNLGQFGLHIESKASEALHIYATTSLHILKNVLSE